MYVTCSQREIVDILQVHIFQVWPTSLFEGMSDIKSFELVVSLFLSVQLSD